MRTHETLSKAFHAKSWYLKGSVRYELQKLKYGSSWGDAVGDILEGVDFISCYSRQSTNQGIRRKQNKTLAQAVLRVHLRSQRGKLSPMEE